MLSIFTPENIDIMQIHSSWNIRWVWRWESFAKPHLHAPYAGIKKQPPRGVSSKRCSENIQQIYRWLFFPVGRWQLSIFPKTNLPIVRESSFYVLMIFEKHILGKKVPKNNFYKSLFLRFLIFIKYLWNKLF